MRIGVDDRKKVIALAVLLAIAIPSLIWSARNIWPRQPEAAKLITPQNVTSTAGKADIRYMAGDTILRADLLLASREISRNSGVYRNIFRMIDISVPPPQEPQGTTPQRHLEQTVSELPPINLRYFGFSSRRGQPKMAFLTEDEEIFVAREGDIINRQYRIFQITESSVMVEDILNNRRQLLPLTAAEKRG